MSNTSIPFMPLIFPLEHVAPAEREPRTPFDRSDRPALRNWTGASSAWSTRRPSGGTGWEEAGDGHDLSDEGARQVDDGVLRRVPPIPPLVGLEAPGVEARVVAPVLQVAAAEVPDLAELAGVDQLPRQPHRGDEAVVEAAEVLDARRLDALPDLVALGGVAAERLLAEDVLAGLGGGDRRLGVERVGAAVVEEGDPRIGDEVVPVGRPVLVAVPRRHSAMVFLFRPATATSRGWSGVSSRAISRNARECALPMKA